MSEVSSTEPRNYEDIIADSRALSDCDLVVGGAVYTGSVLRPTPPQLEVIREEFAERDRAMASRAVFLGELIRGGAQYKNGVLMPSTDQVAEFHAEMDSSMGNAELAPDLTFWPSVDDTMPLDDIVSAGENELSLTANIHTLLQPHFALLDLKAPSESKALWGDRKRIQSWRSSRRVNNLPDVVVQNELTYRWVEDKFLPTKGIVALGVSERDLKLKKSPYRRSGLHVVSEFHNGILDKIKLLLPLSDVALKKALHAEGLHDLLPDGYESHSYTITLGVGLTKTIDMEIYGAHLSYVYDNVKNQFAISGQTYSQYPEVLSAQHYEDLVRCIVDLLPTSSY